MATMGLELPDTDAVESLGFQRRLDDVCSRFEVAWKTGKPPLLEDYLQAVPADDCRELLDELLALDEYYRRMAGEAPSDHDYIAQIPHHAETIRKYFAARVATPSNGDPGGAKSSGLPTVPGYSVERELGRGGMGVVYLAMQDRPRRHVVLKMIRDGALAHPAVLGRFQTESEAIARLQHPNIVQVYAVGEHDGRPFMVLEYVAGGGLDRQLDGKPIAPRDAANLIEQLAKAVHYAHQQGVIHRDLKPANVLLSVVHRPLSIVETKYESSNGPRTMDYGQIKIADFGLAKLLQDDVGSLTMTGETLGTPSYMAPEQARGQTAEIGPATDVFALGAILYQLLTGRPPFLGLNAVTTLEHVTGLDPVPPRQLQPQVPRDLNTICLKCLEKSPRQRYASADDLADDVRRFQAGMPIQARAVSAPERAIRWSRRYPAAAGLITALFLGLATTMALVVRLEFAKQSEQRANAKSIASLQHAQDSVRKSLVFLVEDEEMMRKGLYELRLRMLSAITEQAESIRAQNDNKLLMARELAGAYLRISSLQQQLGQLSKTGQSLESALNLYQMLTANDPENADIRIGVANCYMARGAYFRNEFRHEQARADFQQSVAHLRHVVGGRPDDLAVRRKLTEVLIASGDQEQLLKDFAKSDTFYREALAATLDWARIKPVDAKALIAQAKIHLGISENVMAVEQDRQLEEAADGVRRAGAAMDGAFDTQPDDVAVRLSIAMTYVALSKQSIACKLHAETELYLRRAVATLERLCLEVPAAQNYRWYLAQANFRLGNLFRSLGQAGAEDTARRRSFASIEDLIKTGPVTLATQQRSGVMTLVRYYIGYLIRAKKLDEAMQCIDRAEQMNELIFGPDNSMSLLDNRSAQEGRDVAKKAHASWVCQLEMDRATVHDAASRYRDSIAAWDRSMSLHPSFRTHQQVGRILALAGAGEYEQALIQGKEMTSDKDMLNENLYDLARAYSRCCHVGARDDRREELSRTAVEYLNKALAKGHFDTPDEIELLTSDRDLEPLRGRADFAALLKAVTEKRPR
jgi:eukaryotic-like serine/threonine-protein kinase